MFYGTGSLTRRIRSTLCLTKPGGECVWVVPVRGGGNRTRVFITLGGGEGVTEPGPKVPGRVPASPVGHEDPFRSLERFPPKLEFRSTTIEVHSQDHGTKLRKMRF